MSSLIIEPPLPAIIMPLLSLPSRLAAPAAGPRTPSPRARRCGTVSLAILAALALAATLALPASAAAREIRGLALVRDDGSLRIAGRTIHLYGIYIPPTNTVCRSFEFPPTCAERAVLALEFKVEGFVSCEIAGRNADGDLTGICRVGSGYFDEGEDLAAYLLERGWALALPDAPFEYHALEKIAYRRGMGIWGFPVDGRRFDRLR
jgi:endonuclease YncB( thermonuclease family)